MAEREIDWSRFSERDLLEITARNTKRAADVAENIRWWVQFAVSASIGAAIGYQIKHEGWRSLFGGWL